jgi:hypothetical protein
VPGVATVLGFPHRTKEGALALARRCAINPDYLVTIVMLDGVSDERPARTPAAVAVA